MRTLSRHFQGQCLFWLSVVLLGLGCATSNAQSNILEKPASFDSERSSSALEPQNVTKNGDHSANPVDLGASVSAPNSNAIAISESLLLDTHNAPSVPVQEARAASDVREKKNKGALVPSTSIQASTEGRVDEYNDRIILAGTLDGFMHGISTKTGRVRWHFQTGGPLVATTHKDSVCISGSDAIDDLVFIPSLDGSLYAYVAEEGLQKVPFTAREIVEASPFRTGDSSVLLGKKTTRIYAVDSLTGTMLYNFTSAFEGIEKTDKRGATASTLFIGRCEYSVTAIDLRQFTEQYTFYVGEYVIFPDLAAALNHTDAQKDNPGGPVHTDQSTVVATVDGKIYYLEAESGKALWEADLSSPTVNVFQMEGGKLKQELSLSHDITFSCAQGMCYGTPAQMNVDLLGPSDKRKDTAQTGRNIPSVYISLSGGQLFAMPNYMNLQPVTVPTDKNAPILAVPYQYSPLTEYLPAPPGADSSTTLVKRSEAGVRGYRQNCVPTSSDYPECLTGFHFLEDMGDSVLSNEDNFRDIFHGDLGPYVPVKDKTPGGPKDPQNDARSTEGREGAQPTAFVVFGVEMSRSTLVLAAAGYLVLLAIVAVPVMMQALTTLWEYVKGHTWRRKRVVGGTLNGNGKSLPKNKVQVGKICWYPDLVLGYGSHGTIVYQGQFEGRDVAVKRMLRDFYNTANKEVDLLVHSDAHPNVVRYYAQEECNEWIYLALELCSETLADVVERASFRALDEDGFLTPETLSMLQDLVNGIAHLHNLNIVHRDLKPHNVLCSLKNVLKISDMGLSKKLERDESSFDTNSPVSFGWQSAEVISGGRQKKAVDIFSLGCMIYFILSNGEHAYGDRYEREMNILKSQPNLECIHHLPEAVDLLSRMLKTDAALRPSASEIPAHPLFFSPSRKLSFLQEVSDHLERKGEEGSLLHQRMEENSSVLLGNGWDRMLDASLLENLGKFRSYSYTSLTNMGWVSVRDLLRMIRNRRHHFRDLPEDVRALLSPVPEGFVRYFCKRYPALFMHVYSAVRDTCGDEPVFRVFFDQ